MIDFESPEFDGADVLREDARIDAAEAVADAHRNGAAKHAFEAAVLQHAVNTCLSSCLDCLDLLYIPREQQPISDVAVAHDSWRQEAEPEPCSKDSWLRGAIPEAPLLLLQHNNNSSCSSGQAPALPNSSVLNSPKGSLSSRPMSGLSAAARRNSLGSAVAEAALSTTVTDAAASSMRRASLSRPSGRPTPAVGRSPSVRSHQSMKDGAATAAAGSSTIRRSSIRPAAQQQQQQHAAGMQSSHADDAEDRLRQELQVRRQQEAVTREMKQKAEQARAALIAVQRELKGKEYTYDGSGKLVLLQQVDPEHLPGPPGPQFKVHTPAAAAEADAPGKQGSTSKGLLSSSRSLAGPGGRGSSSTGNGKMRGSREPAVPSSDFKQTVSQTQPPVLETLRPAAGVTLRAGAAAKPGPKRELAGHPTRAQYQQQAKAQNQQATRIATSSAAAAAAGLSSSADARSAAGNASISSSSSAGVAPAAATLRSSSSSAAGVGQAAAGAAVSSSGRASPAVAASGDSRGGLSSAGAASMLSSSAGPNGAKQRAGADVGHLRAAAAAAAAAAAGSQRRPSSPDVNLVLVSAADWGAVGNSGYSPPLEAPLAVHKPSDKQIKEEFGRTTFLPKIRSPVQTLKPPRNQPASTGSLRTGPTVSAAR